MVHQHDIVRLQVCVYEMNIHQVLERSSQLKKKKEQEGKEKD